MTTELRGFYPVLLTPLQQNRKQDLESLRQMISYYERASVHGFVALGEVSESAKLTDSERKQNLSTVMERVGRRLPVVVGASRESTELAVEAAQWAESKGASAVMLAPPKNVQLRERAIFEHYKTVSDSIKLPIVVQDEPEGGHPYMSPELLAKINLEVGRAEYVKLEDAPTPDKVEIVRELTKDRAKIFGASHGKGYLWEMDRGAVGIMTSSPTPEYFVAIWNALQRGKRELAAEVFFYNLSLIHFYSEMAIAVKKEVFVQRGVIKTSRVKQPGRELGERERAELSELLRWVEANVARVAGIAPLHWKHVASTTHRI